MGICVNDFTLAMARDYDEDTGAIFELDTDYFSVNFIGEDYD
jgi:hypothetical protein